MKSLDGATGHLYTSEETEVDCRRYGSSSSLRCLLLAWEFFNRGHNHREFSTSKDVLRDSGLHLRFSELESHLTFENLSDDFRYRPGVFIVIVGMGYRPKVDGLESMRLRRHPILVTSDIGECSRPALKIFCYSWKVGQRKRVFYGRETWMIEGCHLPRGEGAWEIVQSL